MPRNTHPQTREFHRGYDLDSVVVLPTDITASHAFTVDGNAVVPAGSTLHDYLVALNELVTDGEVSRHDAFAFNNVIKATITPTVRWTFKRRLVPVESAQAAFDWFDFPGGTPYWYCFSPPGVYPPTYDITGNFDRDGEWLGDSWTVAYANGYWVMGGEFGGISYTTDPRKDANWSWTLDVPIRWVYDIIYHSGLWIAVGDGIATATHPAGPWTFRANQSVAGSSSIWRIAYGGSLLIACDYFGGGYATSPDGITWTSRSLPLDLGYIVSIACDGTTWVMAGGAGSGPSHQSKIVTSTDGINWMLRHTGSNSSNQFSDVAYGNGKWTACGYDFAISSATVTTATDPTGTWAKQSLGTNNFPNRITYGADGSNDGAGSWLLLPEMYNLPPKNVYVAADPAGAWTAKPIPTDRDMEMTDAFYAEGVWVTTAASNGDGPRVFISEVLTMAPTMDAYIARLLIADATIRRTQTVTFTGNAVILGAQTHSFVADAVVFSLHLDADAVMLRTATSSATANAFIHASFTANATITGFTANAAIVAAIDLAYLYFDAEMWLGSLGGDNPYRLTGG